VAGLATWLAKPLNWHPIGFQENILTLSGGALVFKTGQGAYEDIRKNGFSAERIGTIVGASGGAKWLVLSQLDRVILKRVVPAIPGPVHLLGSSIGAWRFSCYAQDDPVAAVERFERAYVEQRYSTQPDEKEISDSGRMTLETILGENGVDDIMNHPKLRTHMMTVKSRLITSSDNRVLLAAGLIAAIGANLLHRRFLGAFFSRGLFSDPRDKPPFYDVSGFPIHHIRLINENFRDAIIASGSIPMVMQGVRDIHGAPPGTYRDGGVIDYHFDMPTVDEDRISLFPHFFDWLKPGWFDRKLAWRKVNPKHMDRTLLICPSPEFIARLPDGKVPDRTDFVRMSENRRIRLWWEVVKACEELAEELNDVLDKDQLATRLESLC
jgi:hypothetical protein